MEYTMLWFSTNVICGKDDFFFLKKIVQYKFHILQCYGSLYMAYVWWCMVNCKTRARNFHLIQEKIDDFSVERDLMYWRK